MRNPISHIRGTVKRARAEQYLLLMLLSFAVSVSVTRLFLELTGYPQLGNSELHIAHVLWGGLLLFIAVLVMLIVANRWSYVIGALAGGIGVGLFIDEVGKFITQSNDYFTPLAAPIIYAVFLLTVLVYLRVRRPPSQAPRTELYYALDALMEVLERDLDPQEQAELEARLQRVVAQTTDADYARLAEALLVFLGSESLHLVADEQTIIERAQARLAQWEARWLSRARARRVLTIGLSALGLLTLLELGGLALAFFVPDLLEASIIDLINTEPFVQGATSTAWFLVMSLLETMVGLLLILGAVLLWRGREYTGVRLGDWGLLLALTTVNLLVFYFDQFSTILLAAVQFALWMALLRYRHRFLLEPEAVPQAVAV